MSRFFTCLLVIGAGVMAVQPSAQAAEGAQSSSLAKLKARIEALESNARALQQQAQQALDAAQQAQAALEKMQTEQRQHKLQEKLADLSKETPAAGGSGIGVGNDFNPAIAVILNGRYVHHSLEEAEFGFEGFPAGGEAEPLAQGISLGESEISLAANIDDKLYGQLSVAIESEDGEDHIAVEEAYIDATALPAGLGIRAGRFFSNIGYLNSHHAHTDFFSVRPLVYQAFLGGQYGDDGVRVDWVAPTRVFVHLSGEVFRGTGYPSAGAQHEGTGTRTLALHMGGDVGGHNAWLAGVSALRTDVVGGEDGFSGRDTLYVADATWKWSADGNFKDGGLLLRGEYMLDQRDGAFALASPATEAWAGNRSGYYLEGVYNFNRRWSTGYRYDRLRAADEGPLASNFDPAKHSVMLSWRNSEFSLLRLQGSHAEIGEGRVDNALILQYQVALGAHGAHKF